MLWLVLSPDPKVVWGNIGDVQHVSISRSVCPRFRSVSHTICLDCYSAPIDQDLLKLIWVYGQMCNAWEFFPPLQSFKVAQWLLLENLVQAAVQPLMFGTDWNWSFLPSTIKGCSVTFNAKYWPQSAQPLMIWN